MWKWLQAISCERVIMMFEIRYITEIGTMLWNNPKLLRYERKSQAPAD